ncbi:hypothetical protein AB0L00_05080 [Actinoallomurus sp. NPDC052308]|uniref:hypothetical protein n=1 Tax=Actinoallomurus sp. NPDC052308 TaxID=3155530 RepID=UPI003429EFCB
MSELKKVRTGIGGLGVLAATLAAAGHSWAAAACPVMAVIIYVIGELMLQHRRDSAIAERANAKDLVAYEAVKAGSINSADLAAYLLDRHHSDESGPAG